MKKIIFPIAFICLTIVSCQKDYSCKCDIFTTTTTETIGEASQVQTYESEENFQILNAKKRAAQSICNEATIVNTNQFSVGVNSTVTNVEERTCSLSK